jgi:hypothetical protein
VTARTIIVDGLTNGQEYTFTVQATNSVGSSEFSDPSAGVTPTTTTVSPPSEQCVSSIDYEEKLLASGARQAAFQAPCMQDLGKVRIGFFIAEEETAFGPEEGGIVYGDGDGRTFDQNMQPEDNRVYFEVDFSTGTGFVFSNRSCTDKTETSCRDALVIGDNFSSGVRRDGGIQVHFEIGNSRTTHYPGINTLKISADVVILPKPSTANSPQDVCVMGEVSGYPSVEGYYEDCGATYTLFQLGQSSVAGGGLPIAGGGLALPDRDLPEC